MSKDKQSLVEKESRITHHQDFFPSHKSISTCLKFLHSCLFLLKRDLALVEKEASIRPH
jgi:hypothetical protein